MKIRPIIANTSLSSNSIYITSPLREGKKKFHLPNQGKQPPPFYGALRISFDINAIISHFYIFVNSEL